MAKMPAANWRFGASGGCSSPKSLCRFGSLTSSEFRVETETEDFQAVFCNFFEKYTYIIVLAVSRRTVRRTMKQKIKC